MRQKTGHPALCAVLLLLLSLSGSTGAFGGDGTKDTDDWRFGYSSRVLFELSREDAKTAMDSLVRTLAREAGFAAHTKAIIYEDLPSLVAAVRDEEVDFIALTTLEYMKIRDRLGLEPALFGTVGGQTGDEQILLVRRDSGFDQLGKLRDGKLMFLGGGKEISSLWLDILLARQGLPPTEQFFGAVKEAGKAHQTILPVFFKQADACVVNRNAYLTAVELNPQIGRELAVLATSPPFPVAFSCFRKNQGRGKKENFLKAYEKMLATPAGRQVLTLFRVDGTKRAQPGDLDTIEALLKEHGTLKYVAKRK